MQLTALYSNRSKRELARQLITNLFFAILKSSSCIQMRSQSIQPLHHTARRRSPILNKRAPLHFSDSTDFSFRIQFAKFGIVKRILYIIILKFEIMITTYYRVCIHHQLVILFMLLATIIDGRNTNLN